MNTEVEIPKGFQANPNQTSHRSLPGNIAIEEYSGIDDVDDDTDFSYTIGKGRLKKAVQKATQKATTTIKNAQKKVNNLQNKVKTATGNTKKKLQSRIDKTKKTIKKAATKLKKLKKPFAHFNPRNVASRSAALYAFRTNMYGVSSRLAPAFISDSAFKPDAKATVKPKWEKIKKFWVKIGGSVPKLESAIRKGYKIRPVKNLSSKVGFKKTHSAAGDELSEVEIPQEAQGGLEGMPIVGAIIKLLRQLPLIKNVFKNNADAPEGLDDAITDGEEFSTDEDIFNIGPDGEPMEDGEPIESEEILGIPKTPFIIGAALLGTTAVVLIAAFAMKGKGKGKAAAPSPAA